MKRNLLTTLFFVFAALTMNAQLLLNEGFEGGVLPAGWTLQTVEHGWAVENNVGAHTGDYGIASYYSPSTSAKDDWFFTPGIVLTSGQTYAVTFWVQGEGWGGVAESLELMVGTDTTSASMTDQLWDSPSTAYADWTQIIATYTPAADGTYYFGWHAYSQADLDYIAVDDITIFEATTNTVTFTVTDGSNPLQNAIVNFGGIELITDVNGQVAKDTISGNYQVITSLFNYANDTTSFAVIDAPLSVDITLNMNPYIVTFNCNINDSITSGYFVPGTDTLSVTGSMVGWSGPGSNSDLFMTDADADGIYTVSMNLAVGSYTYKYFKNAGWANGEWNGGADRAFDVVDADVVLNDWFGDPNSHEGINEISSEGISVYPNPSNGVFNINVDKSYNLEVFDITGRVINTRTLTGNTSMKLNAAGVYFMRFSNEKGSFTQKVIVR